MEGPNWIDWRVDILEGLIYHDKRYHELSIDGIIDRLKKIDHLTPLGNFEEDELRKRLKLKNHDLR